jgi:hypothetical protein
MELCNFFSFLLVKRGGDEKSISGGPVGKPDSLAIKIPYNRHPSSFEVKIGLLSRMIPIPTKFRL